MKNVKNLVKEEVIESPEIMSFKNRVRQAETYLSEKSGVRVSHSHMLEAASIIEGHRGWNEYSAQFQKKSVSSVLSEKSHAQTQSAIYSGELSFNLSATWLSGGANSVNNHVKIKAQPKTFSIVWEKSGLKKVVHEINKLKQEQVSPYSPVYLMMEKEMGTALMQAADGSVCDYRFIRLAVKLNSVNIEFADKETGVIYSESSGGRPLDWFIRALGELEAVEKEPIVDKKDKINQNFVNQFLIYEDELSCLPNSENSDEAPDFQPVSYRLELYWEDAAMLLGMRHFMKSNGLVVIEKPIIGLKSTISFKDWKDFVGEKEAMKPAKFIITPSGFDIEVSDVDLINDYQNVTKINWEWLEKDLKNNIKTEKFANKSVKVK